MELFRSSPATKRNAFLSIAILSLLVEVAKEKKGNIVEVKFTDSILMVSKLIVFKILLAAAQKVIFRSVDRL